MDEDGAAGADGTLAAHGRSLSLGDLDFGHETWDPAAEHSSLTALGVPPLVGLDEDELFQTQNLQQQQEQDEQQLSSQQLSSQQLSSQQQDEDEHMLDANEVRNLPLLKQVSALSNFSVRTGRPRALSDGEFMHVDDLFGTPSLSRRSLAELQLATPRAARERAQRWWDSAKESAAKMKARRRMGSQTESKMRESSIPSTAVDARVLFHASSPNEALTLIASGGGQVGNFVVQQPFRHQDEVELHTDAQAQSSAPSAIPAQQEEPQHDTRSAPRASLHKPPARGEAPEQTSEESLLSSQGTDANTSFSSSGRSFLLGIMGMSTNSIGFSDLNNPMLGPSESSRGNLKRSEASSRAAGGAPGDDGQDGSRNKRQTLPQRPKVSVVAVSKLFANANLHSTESNGANASFRKDHESLMATKLRALRRGGAQSAVVPSTNNHRLPMYFLL
ncbi:Hypothetical Protein FCC1311_087172 [Hondaea fermentalgiana]|uniref:Uncharacterized protein n=1 Tax=Hondaea fermentalgiana TaxID=2315210 RepID=A0A2R5GNM3_9STRA|nr:Hypothetical Protein FCC1311_087172 [Hondaea fermentalgiana]|eukprot:GBG32492.1 Hypothetical Protein FCC1311_087172 [Hondaea fermentalgiana]